MERQLEAAENPKMKETISPTLVAATTELPDAAAHHYNYLGYEHESPALVSKKHLEGKMFPL